MAKTIIEQLDIELLEGEEVSEDTLSELSDGKGEDE